MTRLGATLAACLCLLGATAGGAASTDHALLAGDGLLIGPRLACSVERAQNVPAVICLDRNPKRNEVYRKSLGVAMIGGSTARVAIQYYDKNGNAGNIWLRRQPHHPGSGLFRSAIGGRELVAVPGDRYAVGGTSILCPVSASPAILCAIVNTKTLKPVPGTYGIYADGKSVEVIQVTPGGGFKTIKAYKEPPLKG